MLPGPIGTDCVSLGVSLATLPIRRGYYRASSRSTNVVRCSDSGAGCGTSNECANSTSGCRGGSDFSLACQPSLRGIYCQVCDQPSTGSASNYTNSSSYSNLPRYYYVPATSSAPAHCEECGGTGIFIVAVMCGVLIGLAGLLIFMKRAIKRFTKQATRDRVSSAWRILSIATKLKM